MIEKIKKEVERRKLHGWKIFSTEIEKSQRYLIRDQTETVLKSVRKEVFLTVYIKKKGKVGEGIVTLTEDSEISKKIDEAIVAAAQTLSQAWTLPKPGTYPKVKIHDPFIVRAFVSDLIDEEVEEIEKTVRKAVKKERGITLNAAELSISYKQSYLLTSTGVNLRQESTFVFCDLAITARHGSQEMDFTPQLTARRLSDFTLQSFITLSCQRARDAASAESAQQHSGKVILSEEAVRDFFVPPVSQMSPYITHLLGRLLHAKIVQHKKGEQFAPHALTLYTDPTLDYGLASTAFDADGSPAKKSKLIDQGKIVQFVCSKKYAEYLKTAVSTPIGNVVVESGSKSEEQLCDGEHIEIVKFSSFVPDWVSGNFSAEVRLGYRIVHGLKVPFRGGLLVGNVFALDLQCSKETIGEMGYYGPKKVAFTAQLNAQK